jgi:hypothetical protein
MICHRLRIGQFYTDQGCRDRKPRDDSEVSEPSQVYRARISPTGGIAGLVSIKGITVAGRCPAIALPIGIKCLTSGEG